MTDKRPDEDSSASQSRDQTSPADKSSANLDITVIPAAIEATDVQSFAKAGQTIGMRYQLLEKVGEGGMGEVWNAKQIEPVKRNVALKLIKTGMDSKAVLARFEQERQALAIMDHPNIARVLDGGMTPGGQPFFVMELVNGLPLTKFCDKEKLALQQRLELFVLICQAVQHAHHKGIIHRDLKPANILVSMIDGRPVPKVIDFGVAKAIAGRLTDESLSTQFGAVVGTLEYMSPEQAGFSGEDIDTRADIYSLGVILYELLTGMRPIDADRLKRAALTEMIRIIREEEPSRPSTRLSSSNLLPSIAAVRSIDPKSLTQLLRGELDWVVMKCLEKQRDRRYETANALARDMQRYIANEPVEARPPSTGYRLRKLLRRHQGAVTAVGLILLTMLVGTIFSWRQAVIANEAAAAERDANLRAQKRLEQIEIGADVLGSIFADLDLRKVEGDGKTLEQVLGERLKNAAALITTSDAIGDPLVSAKLQSLLGKSLYSLGYVDEPISLFEASVAAYLEQLGPDAPETLTARHNLAESYVFAGRYGDAIPMHKDTLQRSRKTLGPEHYDTLGTLKDLGNAYIATNDYAAGIPLLEETLKLVREHVEPSDQLSLTAMNSLAVAYQNADRLDEALPLYEETLRLRKEVFGADHYDTMTGMNNLASGYYAKWQIDKALPLMKEVYELRKAKLGPQHPHTVISMTNFAVVLESTGRREEALPYFEESLAISEEVNGNDHPGTLLRVRNLANCLRDLGQVDGAFEEYQKYVDRHAAREGKDSLAYADALIYLGFNQVRFERWADAEPVLRQCLELRTKFLEPNAWQIGGVQSLLGATLVGLSRYDEAEPLLISGYTKQKAQQEAMPSNVEIGLQIGPTSGD